MPKGTPYIQPAQKNDWETPRDLFDKLWDEADGYDMDPCCRVTDYTAQKVLQAGGTALTLRGRYTAAGWQEQGDGLTLPWHGKVFMNSPYGLALRKWVPKAVEEVRSGRVEFVTALLPSKTDTQWWQEYILRIAYKSGPDGDRTYVGGTKAAASEVWFLKGRLTFGGAPDPAGFASVIVVWRR